MNKKILSLFLVVAASAILAISCNNKATNPTSTSSEPKTVTEEDFKNAVDGISYKTWSFKGKGTGFKSGTAIEVEATSDSDSLATIEKEFGSALKSALAAKGIDVGTVKFDKGTAAATSNKDAVTFKFTPKPLAGSNFDEKLTESSKQEVTIKLTPKDNWKA